MCTAHSCGLHVGVTVDVRVLLACLCAQTTCNYLTLGAIAGLQGGKEFARNDYERAKWLALHSLKSHPSREDTVVFKGFGNFDEDGRVDEDSIAEYLNEENAQLLLQQQPSQEQRVKGEE